MCVFVEYEWVVVFCLGCLLFELKGLGFVLILWLFDCMVKVLLCIVVFDVLL